MRAAYSGKTDIVVVLLKAGANCDLQNKVCTVCSDELTHGHEHIYTWRQMSLSLLTLGAHAQRGLL